MKVKIESLYSHEFFGKCQYRIRKTQTQRFLRTNYFLSKGWICPSIHHCCFFKMLFNSCDNRPVFEKWSCAVPNSWKQMVRLLTWDHKQLLWHIVAGILSRNNWHKCWVFVVAFVGCRLSFLYVTVVVDINVSKPGPRHSQSQHVWYVRCPSSVTMIAMDDEWWWAKLL